MWCLLQMLIPTPSLHRTKSTKNVRKRKWLTFHEIMLWWNIYLIKGNLVRVSPTRFPSRLKKTKWSQVYTKS